MASSTPTSCIPFQECRAKTCPNGSPGTSVFDHCRYAGYVAEALLALLPEPIRKLLPFETPFFVSLHDIGKVSPGFEGKYFIDLLREKAPDWVHEVINNGVTTSHAIVGARALQRLFELDTDHPVLRAVASHHGFMPDSLLATKDGCWQSERAALVEALAHEFGTSSDVAVDATCDTALLAGITCVADWIASDEDFFPPDLTSLSSEEGRSRASYAVAMCGFAQTSFRHGLSFRDVFGFDPYPAQQAFLDAVTTPGVYVLEAPMGMGKTESALYAAYKLVETGLHSGIYFALPTRLTSDRIHERVETFLKAVSETPTAVKLAHGQAWLKEDENKDNSVKLDWGGEGTRKVEGEKTWFEIPNPNDQEKLEKLCVPRWFNPAKRGLLFPFAVGTIDQALMAVLNVKHSFVRSFGLAGKIVILDEVHSYDAYTGTLLDELVKRLRDLGCTVLILSATLTAARRKALLGPDAPDASGYPLLTGIRADGESVARGLSPPPSKSANLRWIDASVESPLAIAVAKARAGCNVLCIANTVATAQEWYRKIKSYEMKEGDRFPVGLLHAKFTAHDRDRIENEWMVKLGKPPKEGYDPRPHGSILVSTQIVEQSVDIDADWMLSELAPVDMLLQRLGRLWRHERPNRPVGEPELAIVCAKMPADDLSDLPSETKELEAFFGRGVWVYAPYVLLRTLETLRERGLILVPDDIRTLLETVYAETIPDTDLHRTFFNDMTSTAEQLHRYAIMGQSDALPTKNDNEESAKTRYNSRPSASLLIARSLDAITGRMVLLDGTEVTISRFERNFKVTKALYRNLVQVAPNDVLRTVDGKTKELLSRHFFASDMPRICTWDALSGVLSLPMTEESSGYIYHPAYGAYRNQGTSQSDSPEPAVPKASSFEKIDSLTIPPDSDTLSEPECEFSFDNGKDW